MFKSESFIAQLCENSNKLTNFAIDLRRATLRCRAVGW